MATCLATYRHLMFGLRKKDQPQVLPVPQLEQPSLFFKLEEILNPYPVKSMETGSASLSKLLLTMNL
jgi:hypothetical protein